MRKWLPVTAFIIVAVLASIYIFIPRTLNIIQITPVHCTINGAYRNISTADKWRQWWPSGEPVSSGLHYQGVTYHITKTLVNTIGVHIQHQDISVNSTIHLLPLPADSVVLEWKCTFASGMNPFKRIQRYRQAIAIKNNMAAVMALFKAFAEKKENIYGITIRESSTKDTLLIATKTSITTYPSVADIYKLINALKKYSAGQQAQQTGYPMLNITPLNPIGYQVMAALPIDKRIPDNGQFFKRHLVPGKFLVTQVKGGDSTIKQAFTQLQLYVQDYRRISMAIPFQQLITDRSAETDTSKWITDIYVPVF
jgi:hypothetical protein